MSTCFCSKIRDAVLAKGGTEATLDQIGQPESQVFIDNFADMLVKAELKTRKVFPVTVDYNRTLEQMISACACGYNNPNITAANFPISGTGIVQQEIILVDFDHDVESDEVVRELAAMEPALEPARIEHALAFGEKYPDVQRERPVLFLGSVWGNLFPCLGPWSDLRWLDLQVWHVRWSRFCRFAAIRQSAKATL